MNTTIDKQSPAVSNGEMQAAKELCARLESLGLLESIEGDAEHRHTAWIFTPKGKEAMSLETRSDIGGYVEKSR
jgi:hypothetical protein